MFMLESHLSADQSRAVSEIQAAATQRQPQCVPDRRGDARHAGRLSDARYRFHRRGQRVKLAQAVAKKSGAKILSRGRQPQSWRICFSRAAYTPPSGWRGRRSMPSPAPSRMVQARHHSRGPARARFHHQLHRAVAQSGVARSAARSQQRRRRSGAQRTARGQQLHAVRRSHPSAADAPIQGAAELHHRRAHQDAV